jgi:energy-coupling factor transport system permease protein
VLLKGLTMLGLAGMLGTLFALTYAGGWAAWLGLILSAGMLTGVFWAQGRRVTRSRYHRERWGWRDGLAIGTALAVIGLLIAVRIVDGAALRYYPYTQLLPPFEPWLGAALLLLVAPALLQSTDKSVQAIVNHD